MDPSLAGAVTCLTDRVGNCPADPGLDESMMTMLAASLNFSRNQIHQSSPNSKFLLLLPSQALLMLSSL